MMQGLPIDSWTAYTSTQVGRDKVYRLVQYFARFLAAYTAGDTQARLNKLSGAFGTGRKLFRLAKPLENLNAILKSSSIGDDVVRYTTIGRNAGLGTWLFYDMVQYFNGIGVIKVDDIKTVNTNANRAWLIGLLFSVAQDLYKLQQNAAKMERAIKSGDQEAARKEVKQIEAERFGLLVDTVRDTLDLALPGSALEYVKIDSGLVGLIGAITSLIGIWQGWPVSKK